MTVLSEHDELLPVFVDESLQHLQNVEPDLLALERDGEKTDPEIVNKIFRSIHSIKGASGFFGLQNISRLSHVMENTLVLLRDGKIKPSSKLIDALLSSVDALRAMVEDIRASDQFNINHELVYLQKVIDEASEPQKKVTVISKKPSPAEKKRLPDITKDVLQPPVQTIAEPISNKQIEKPDPESGRFDVSESELRYFISKGLNLYAIKIFLNLDLRQKNRSPYDFIQNMESQGMYVDSFLDIQSVTGLSDCLNNEIAFDFLFATKLPPEAVGPSLGVPNERIAVIDLNSAQSETPSSPPIHPAVQPTISNRSDNKEKILPESNHDEPHQVDEEREQHDEELEREKPPLSEFSDKSLKSIQADEKIRVSVNFLNDLVNLAGELVLGRNQLMQFAQPLSKSIPGLNPVLQHISRVTSEMQEKVMQMRMQPISLVFNKFHRVVRSLAKNHYKEVKLITQGEDVELDRTIIEGLSDPLTHLIRNAVDHGLELPDEREKIGKPRLGTIKLKAYHQGGQVHLEISDDGRGIDGKIVGRKAVEKGLLTTEQVNAMTEKELVRIIFLPGFSTAEKVTDLSGRGVGMDVVITNIEHLGGTVDIDTKAGKGTKIILALPLTLAIVSGLMIRAQNHFFIIPEVDIDELVRIKPEEIKNRINIVQNASVLRLRDTLLPLVNLNDTLRISSGSPDSIVNQTSPMRILVIKHGSARYGLIVDSIESMEEIVVKPLPRYLKKMKTFSGVSILGNGKVSMILDVAGIIKKARIRQIETTSQGGEDEERRRVEAEEQTFLLFDNKTAERFALPLELISRIELVSPGQIERIKDKFYIQYHGKKLRLIHLEDYLPVARPERNENDEVGVIVPRQIKQPLGIVFSNVINTIKSTVELDTITITGPGLFGSTVLDGKITLLPDMYRLFELAAPEWFENNAIQDPSRPLRVLLAEDTPFFRMVESEYLTSGGYEVILAEDGKQAMHILNEDRIDAVVLDMIMPKMDGWDVIRAIRSDDRLKHLPVMALTSLNDEEAARRGIQAGFDEWELKLDKVRLLEKLAKITKTHRQ